MNYEIYFDIDSKDDRINLKSLEPGLMYDHKFCLQLIFNNRHVTKKEMQANTFIIGNVRIRIDADIRMEADFSFTTEFMEHIYGNNYNKLPIEEIINKRIRHGITFILKSNMTMTLAKTDVHVSLMQNRYHSLLTLILKEILKILRPHDEKINELYVLAALNV